MEDSDIVNDVDISECNDEKDSLEVDENDSGDSDGDAEDRDPFNEETYKSDDDGNGTVEP